MSITQSLAHSKATLSSYQILASNFPAAEAAARHGLEVDPTQTWINTILASALLFQGKWEEAKTIYERLVNEPFSEGKLYRDIFLEDLQTLEAAGITHPDVVRARALLEGK